MEETFFNYTVLKPLFSEFKVHIEQKKSLQKTINLVFIFILIFDINCILLEADVYGLNFQATDKQKLKFLFKRYISLARKVLPLTNLQDSVKNKNISFKNSEKEIYASCIEALTFLDKADPITVQRADYLYNSCLWFREKFQTQTDGYERVINGFETKFACVRDQVFTINPTRKSQFETQILKSSSDVFSDLISFAKKLQDLKKSQPLNQTAIIELFYSFNSYLNNVFPTVYNIEKVFETSLPMVFPFKKIIRKRKTNTQAFNVLIALKNWSFIRQLGWENQSERLFFALKENFWKSFIDTNSKNLFSEIWFPNYKNDTTNAVFDTRESLLDSGFIHCFLEPAFLNQERQILNKEIAQLTGSPWAFTKSVFTSYDTLRILIHLFEESIVSPALGKSLNRKQLGLTFKQSGPDTFLTPEKLLLQLNSVSGLFSLNFFVFKINWETKNNRKRYVLKELNGKVIKKNSPQGVFMLNYLEQQAPFKFQDWGEKYQFVFVPQIFGFAHFSNSTEFEYAYSRLRKNFPFRGQLNLIQLDELRMKYSSELHVNKRLSLLETFALEWPPRFRHLLPTPEKKPFWIRMPNAESVEDLFSILPFQTSHDSSPGKFFYLPNRSSTRFQLDVEYHILIKFYFLLNSLLKDWNANPRINKKQIANLTTFFQSVNWKIEQNINDNTINRDRNKG